MIARHVVKILGVRGGENVARGLVGRDDLCCT
jgi:hypothetical protein